MSAAVLVASLGGCAPADTLGSAGASTAADASEDAAARGTRVEIDGTDLILVRDGDRHAVATIEDGELLHAALRPGRDPGTTDTVLALARADGRYELRYLNPVGGEPTELYWFPYRLQIDPGTATTADVPIIPVWAPDGSAVAWLEWNREGTRLRTVGWLDHDAGTNPSDDQATYGLAEVPVGSQLAAWEVGPDGTPTLVTRGGGDERWRIRIEDGAAVVALAPGR